MASAKYDASEAGANRSAYKAEHHGPRRVVGPGFHEKVWDVVRRVPTRRVTTFGDIANELGLRSVARQVGWALAALPPDRDDVPWHRVVNAKGEVSKRKGGIPCDQQVQRLRAEGLVVTQNGRIADFRACRHDFLAQGIPRNSG
jgi:methylated-DNA-protein-cysteine methyltransferase related protein